MRLTLRVMRLVQALCLFTFMVGCGAQEAGSLLDPLSFATWHGQSVGDEMPADGTSSGPEDGSSDGTVVEGETDVRDDLPILCVDVDALDFGTSVTHWLVTVRNCGVGTVEFTAHAGADWLSLDPASGSVATGYVVVNVRVERTGLAVGTYQSQIVFSTPDGQSHTVEVSLTVADENVDEPQADPQLSVSPVELDFGASAQTRSFTLRNVGGGTLAYAVVPGADWLSVTNGNGQLGTNPVTVAVNVTREPLVIGTHEANLEVITSAGTEVVKVRATKPLTSPLLIPWIEVNLASDEEIAWCVAGMRKWQHLTDTVIVSTTPGRAFLYTRLREEVPEMTVIPGLKTATRLGYTGFDSAAGWALLGEAAVATVAAAGDSRLVWENESALEYYWYGGYDIDLDLVAQALSALPQDIDHIWYPALHGHTPEVQEKSRALCAVVEASLSSVRFVDGWVSHPNFFERQEDLDNHATLVALASQPVYTDVAFGLFGDTYYWHYESLPMLMEYTADTPDMILYPGASRWLEAADAFNAILWGSE